MQSYNIQLAFEAADDRSRLDGALKWLFMTIFLLGCGSTSSQNLCRKKGEGWDLVVIDDFRGMNQFKNHVSSEWPI